MNNKIIISGMDTDSYSATKMVNKMRHEQIIGRFTECKPKSVSAHYKGDHRARALMFDFDDYIHCQNFNTRLNQAVKDFAQEFYIYFNESSGLLMHCTVGNKEPAPRFSGRITKNPKENESKVISWLDSKEACYLVAENYVGTILLTNLTN